MQAQGRIYEGPHAPPLGHGTKQKSAKYTLKLHNQTIIKHACRRGLL